MAFFAELQFWHWWIFAVVLMALEALAPGAIFLWLGISAAVVGLALLLLRSLSWEVQLVLFAVLAVITVPGWRLLQRRQRESDAGARLNRRGEQYIGRRFTLDEPVVNGSGRLRIDDTQWRVSGEDLSAGTAVRVTGANGVILLVERA